MNIEIDKVIQVLKEGGIILYPTDTIWGIGCDATNSSAVEKIYKLKQRNDSKSLILLARDLDMVCKYVKEIPSMAIDLVEINDKPMTIIYPGAINLATNVIAEDGSVGIRIPDNSFCQALLRKFNRPIVSTSANISGCDAPKEFSKIAPEIKERVDFIVNKKFDSGASHKASQIIKIGLSNEVEIIRR